MTEVRSAHCTDPLNPPTLKRAFFLSEFAALKDPTSRATTGNALKANDTTKP